MSWWTDFRDDVLKPAIGIAAIFYGGYLVYNALTAASAVAAGMGVAEATAAGVSLGEMAGAGLTAAEAVAAGAGAESCLAAYTATQCYTAGITAAELMGAGASAVELLSAGASIAELASGGASVASLVAEGASAGELLSAGASVGELVEVGVGATELLAGGATAGELTSAGMGVADIVSGASALGATAEHVVAGELLNIGYTAGELATLGVSDAAIVGEFTSSAMLESLSTLAPGQTVQGLTGSQWAALAESNAGQSLNALTSLGAAPTEIYSMSQVGYSAGEIAAMANNGTLAANAVEASEYLAWANSAGAVAETAATTSAISADLITLAEASADPIGTLIQGMGLGESAVSAEVLAAASASVDPIGALIAGIEAGGAGEAAVAAAAGWTEAGYALGEMAGVDAAVAANAAEAAAAPLATAEEMAAAVAAAEVTTAAEAAAAGFTAAEIAAAVAAGVILGPPIIEALTGGGQPTTSGQGNQWFDIPVYTGGGLVNPGVNPGFIKPQPLYNPEGIPGINQYNWGAHGYVQNPEDMANYDMYAPAQPYGNPNAQNLGQLITPDQIGYPSLQSASATQGTSNPTYYNPVPTTPGMAQMQQQFAAPVQPTAMPVPDVGRSIYIAPATPLATTNTSGTMTPNQYTEYLNSLALEAGGQT